MAEKLSLSKGDITIVGLSSVIVSNFKRVSIKLESLGSTEWTKKASNVNIGLEIMFG